MLMSFEYNALIFINEGTSWIFSFKFSRLSF
jgi:hypothetical protein